MLFEDHLQRFVIRDHIEAPNLKVMGESLDARLSVLLSTEIGAPSSIQVEPIPFELSTSNVAECESYYVNAIQSAIRFCMSSKALSGSVFQIIVLSQVSQIGRAD